MSKVFELRKHARNRRLPAAIRLGSNAPDVTVHNLYLYYDLNDPSNYTGIKTAQERHDNAVVGVSTGRDVYDLGEYYNQIHTNQIMLKSNIKAHNTRFSMLEPNCDIPFHMDPPDIYNIISPLTDPIEFKTKELQAKLQVGEIWFVNPSYMHSTSHQSKNTRVAILANFNYSEEVYEYLTGLL